MFYPYQNEASKENYKAMLKIIGNLTRLFSENEAPYLPYRAHENIFCKYFNAENLGRSDCSADARKSKVGIGLKTWVGRDDQKVAEFGRLRHSYEHITGIELVKTIAGYRNERIRITKNLYDIDKMIYHVIKRVPGQMQILECAFDEIDILNIKVNATKGNNNNTYFTDDKHEYHFSTSKNTLYMLFDDLALMETFEVEIMEDPFEYLMHLRGDFARELIKPPLDKENRICLRLYATNSRGEKKVYEKSGLNQWNAGGRKRHPDEIYIPYQKEDRARSIGFFPPREQPFNLRLPDGKMISAKVCQADGKAIMSNPNKVLGEWLLRKVFEVAPGTLITYEMLEKFGIDSVIFTKHSALEYTIAFSELGTYEQFYDGDKSDDDETA